MKADIVWIVNSVINSHHTSLSEIFNRCGVNAVNIFKDKLYDKINKPINVAEIPILILLDPELPGNLIQRLTEWRSHLKWPGASLSPLFLFMVKSTSVEEVQDRWDPYDSNDYDFIPIDHLYKNEIAKNYIQHASKNRKIAEYGLLIGESKPMRQLKAFIEKVKDMPTPVLVTGEAGTGKELVARSLHSRGKRASHPFIVINVAAIPDNLFEANMFGYEKGSFTGAEDDKDGLCLKAHLGTLFMDEIGRLAPGTQPKLLRFLQDYRVQKVGSHMQSHVDVRILAATNLNLDEMVEKGKFGSDLHHRLNVIKIVIPPLRKHKEDIASLLKHFCLKFANRSGIFKTFDDEAQDALLLYNWPGNVRELESVVERGNIVSDSEKILFKDLPDTIKKFYSKRRSASRTENATNHRFPVPAESNGDFNFGQDSEELIKAFVKNGWELQSFLYSIKPLLRLVDVKQFKLKVISIKSKLALMIETCEEDVKAALNFLKCNLNPDNKSYFDPDHELLDQEYLKSAIDFCKGNVQLTSKLLKVLGFEDNVSTGFIKNRLGIDKRNQKKAIDKLSEWYRQKYLS